MFSKPVIKQPRDTSIESLVDRAEKAMHNREWYIAYIEMRNRLKQCSNYTEARDIVGRYVDIV